MIYSPQETLDNIDHNPSSTFSCDALHNTAISVTQHAPHENDGIDRMLPEVPENEGQRSSKSVKALLKSYASVPPVVLPENVLPMTTNERVIPISTDIAEDEMQKLWLQHISETYADKTLDDSAKIKISWSAYFADLQISVSQCFGTQLILPPW